MDDRRHRLAQGRSTRSALLIIARANSFGTVTIGQIAHSYMKAWHNEVQLARNSSSSQKNYETVFCETRPLWRPYYDAECETIISKSTFCAPAARLF